MVTGATNTLQCSSDVPRAANLEHQINRTNVDSHLKRGGRDDSPQMTVLQFLFDVQPDVFVHAAVVPSHQVSKEWSQLLDDGFRHLSRVGKDQRGRVGTDEVSDGFDVVLQQLRHGQVAEFRMRDENVQIQFPRTRYLGDRNRGWLASCLTVIAAHEVFSHGFKRFHGSRDADSLNRVLEQ